MRELFEKKLRAELIYRLIIIVLAVLSVAMFFCEPIFGKPAYAIGGVGLYAALMALIFYFATAFRALQTRKWLRKNEFEHLLDEAFPPEPNLKKSKIYCSHNAFVCKRQFAVIPYSEIAWVYMQQQRSYGIPVGRNINVRLKDGKTFVIEANIEEFKYLLSEFILKKSPDVIVGFGDKQREQFAQKYPEFGKKDKRNATATIVILGVYVAGMLILSIILKEPVAVLSAAVMVLTFVMVYARSKKKK